ncbi:MAG: FtsK/SpoIIIE domain-containing protein [Caldilineaceae bacterium]
MKQPVYIDRPPRIQPELPFGEHEIPRPPAPDESLYMQLVQMALPLLTIIGFVFVATMGGGQSGWLVIPMALSVVASTGVALYTYRKDKQKRAFQARAYHERLVELNKEMNNYHDQQRRFYRYNYPDCTTVARIVENARVEVEKEQRTLRGETRLWERRAQDDDFGVVRLGMGTLPSTVIYRVGEIETMDDALARAAKKLAEDSLFVPDIPIIIALRPPAKERDDDEKKEQDKQKQEADAARTPVTHALGIAGERSAVYALTRALLGHFVTFHAPMDARLYVLATRKQAWTWTESLPHSQADEQQQYTCFVEEIKPDEDEENPFDDAEGNALDQFLENIRKVLATRKIRLQDREENEGKDDPTVPFLLVVVDLLDSTYNQESLLQELESDAAITLLLAEGALLGAAVIFLVPERSKVPSGCLSVIEVEHTTPATNAKNQQLQRLHFRYAEVGVNSFRYVGEADAIAQGEPINALAQRLAELDVRQGFGANLASTVPFMDLMNYATIQQLEQETWRLWQASVQKEYADWLRVKIGLMAGNKPRSLVFSAKRDGVHGMVAGSTGSGKSELLVSLITGMAVTYDPTMLNFVLVDFKRGGAFKDFETLPHCVDIITNLGLDGVTRMFTAISSEMNRRQALNTETGTKNIVDYRQKGLHVTHKPYPFLFIIIDEFAEMIAERPEYKAQLETIRAWDGRREFPCYWRRSAQRCHRPDALQYQIPHLSASKPPVRVAKCYAAPMPPSCPVFRAAAFAGGQRRDRIDPGGLYRRSLHRPGQTENTAGGNLAESQQAG